ncbi:MAG: hypothetical protein PHD74_02975 [Candidatus Krumholzibacteria bacterium]|nr:hypothetical protein [Candidatus Krumholzibacteria bacterium]
MGTAVFILETIVVALSLLVGLGYIAGPAIMRIALSFCALFVIPGASLERLVFGDRSPALESTCRVFALGLVFSSIVVCLGFIPGVSYRAVSSIALLLAVVLAFVSRTRHALRIPPRGDGRQEGIEVLASRASSMRVWILFGVLFALCFIVFSGTGDLGWSSDSLDHVSFVRRSLDSGVLFPHDSFYREGDGVSPDPRKGLWHPVLSLWTYQSRESADRVWCEIPAFMAFLAICAFAFFALELCGSLRFTVLSVVLLLLFCGGEGSGWITKLGYSKNMAQIVLWLDIAFLLKYYRTRQSRDLFMSLFLACIGTAFHVVFALLLGVTMLGVFFYVTFLPDGAVWRGAFWRSVLAQFAGVAPPMLARAGGFASPATEIHTHMQGMVVFGRRLAVVDPAELAAKYGLVFFFAMIMAPFFLAVTRRGNRRSLVFILYVVPVILVLDPLIAAFMERRIGYLHYRILDAAPLFVFLALVIGGLCEMIVFARAGGASGAGERLSLISVRGMASRAFAVLGIAIFVLYPFRSIVPQLKETARNLSEKRRGKPPEYAALFKALGERIPRHSVIVSDPLTSYLVSAYTDHFVAVILDQHCSPFDTSAVDRLREARNLLSPARALEASAPWLMREHADYVLLNMDLPAGADFFNSVLPEAAGKAYEKLLACPSMLSEELAIGGFHLFSVRNNMIDSSRVSSCVETLATSLPCVGYGGREERSGEWGGDASIAGSGTDVGCGIELMTVTIDNSMVQPGDTLMGHFCWRAGREVPFGFPVEAVIRLDGQFPEGKLYREWYGKQYRRFIERRNGCFYRLTWRLRLMSGLSYPDMWAVGDAVRQDFSLPLDRSIAPGGYEVRIKVIRIPYLPVRLPSDYLRNDDSLQGVPVGMIYVQGGGGGPALEGASGRKRSDRR